MATIRINTVSEPVKSSTRFTYTDLKLDLEFDFTRNNEFLKRREIRDLRIDYDYAAVRNSIFNLFNTIPGQKILNPFFGLNLVQYIFQPLSETLANNIGNDILKGLTAFEPRVRVQGINVAVDEPNAQYVITLIVSMPTIKTDASFKLVGALSNLGFKFINN